MMDWEHWGSTGDTPEDIDGLVQDCCISTADALEILQSWTKPLI